MSPSATKVSAELVSNAILNLVVDLAVVPVAVREETSSGFIAVSQVPPTTSSAVATSNPAAFSSTSTFGVSALLSSSLLTVEVTVPVT